MTLIDISAAEDRYGPLARGPAGKNQTHTRYGEWRFRDPVDGRPLGDAPLHFLRRGKGLDEMPLSATVGAARVIEIQDPDSIKVDELRPVEFAGGARILFKTRNSARCWKSDSFVRDFVYLSWN